MARTRKVPANTGHHLDCSVYGRCRAWRFLAHWLHLVIGRRTTSTVLSSGWSATDNKIIKFAKQTKTNKKNRYSLIRTRVLSFVSDYVQFKRTDSKKYLNCISWSYYWTQTYCYDMINAFSIYSRKSYFRCASQLCRLSLKALWMSTSL